MKVGILTFHLGPNHGGFLQAYCLSQYIKSMGNDVEIINYKNAQHHDHETFRPWIYRRPFKLYHAWVKERVFKKAYQQLPLSEFTTDMNSVDWNKYDAVVIGSDVVWDFSWKWLGRDHVYFADFGNGTEVKKIAYAPSSGSVNDEMVIPNWVTAGLSNMDALSARDDATAKMVLRACGREAELVVDPTWLDMRSELNFVEKEKVIILYAFHVKKSDRDAIIKYSREQKLKIVALGYYHSWADENNMKLAPLDWPKLMRQAEAVVTGTFHGTLYAIKMQCQFVTLYNERIKYRVKKPLKASGLEDRLLIDSEKLGALLRKQINYQKVMERLMPYVQSSREYLLRYLGG